MHRNGRLRLALQVDAADCGLACLAATLGYHGVPTTIAELRSHRLVGRDGATAGALVRLATTYGLQAKGMRLDFDEAAAQRPGSILFWSHGHFVVLRNATRRRVTILDPAAGEVSLDREKAASLYRGIALVFEPAPGLLRRPRPTSPAWRLYRASLRASWRWLALVVVSGLLLRLAIPVSALASRTLLQGTARTNGSPRDLGLALAALAVLTGATIVVASLVRSRVTLRVRAGVERLVTSRLLHHVFGVSPDQFLSRSTSDTATRLRSLASLREILTATAVAAILDLPLVVASVGLLFALSPRAGAVALALLVLQCALVVVRRRSLTRASTVLSVRESRSFSELTTAMTAYLDIRYARAEPFATRRYLDVLDEETEASLAKARAFAGGEAVTLALRTMTPLLVLGAVLSTVAGLEIASVATAIAAAQLAALMVDAVAGLAAAALAVEVTPLLLARIDDLLAEPLEPEGDMAPGPLRTISLDGVAHRYAGANADSVRVGAVEVRAGTCLLIRGPSGCGKSTFGRIVAGVTEPTEGTMLVNGLDAVTVERAAWRREVGYVRQDAALLPCSIRENVTLGRAIPDADVLAALDVCEFGDVLRTLPLGLETPVGERGGAFSGGQRQRLVLARAIVCRPSLLVLDEATANLDAATEDRVLTRIRTFLPAAAIVVISHRTVPDALNAEVLDLGAAGLVEAVTG